MNETFRSIVIGIVGGLVILSTFNILRFRKIMANANNLDEQSLAKLAKSYLKFILFIMGSMIIITIVTVILYFKGTN